MEKVNVLDLIPQRTPFVMVDEILQVDEKEASTTFYIAEGNVMSRSGKFRAGGIVENIAQTAAVLAGYGYCKRGEEIPIGFIAGVKALIVKELPSIGDTVTTKIKLLKSLMNVLIIEGSMSNSEGKTLATSEIRIFIQA
jgi:predicted hotdog family 3-hydroxylacyl-ACP dehydratase